MTKSAVSAIIGVSLSASGALAMDWTLKSHLDETVEASNNYFLSPNPSGALYVSTSTLGLDAVGRTPTMRFEINSTAIYRVYEGPAATGMENTLGSNTHVGIENKTDPLTTYNVDASYITQEVSAAQLAETGVVTSTGNVTTELIGAGLTRELTPTDTLHLFATAKSLTFTQPNSTPFTDVTATSNWTHHINHANDFTTLLQFDWLSYDDSARTQLMIARAMPGVRSELSSRLTFTGAVGAVFTNTTSSGTGNQSNASTSVITGQQAGGSTIDWIGNMNLVYRFSAATTITASAVKSSAPSILGQIITSDNFSTTLTHNINAASSVTLWSTYSIITGISPSELFATSASYNYRLTPEWIASLTYTYRDSITTGATASTVILRMSRDATILP